MDSTAAPLQKLIEQFARLPGVGRKMAQRFAFYVLDLPEEKAREFMNTVVIYTQGLVTFIIDGTITISREEAVHMLENVGVMHMVYAGIPFEKATVLLKI